VYCRHTRFATRATNTTFAFTVDDAAKDGYTFHSSIGQAGPTITVP
jgi:hypothetical protein